MKTKNQLVQECKEANPIMIQTINGVEIELTGADYDKACSDWADMKLAQLKVEADIATQTTAKTELLQKLGISENEAKLLLN
jgi:hypothetical protein